MCGAGQPRHLGPGLRPRTVEPPAATPIRARRRAVEVDAIYWAGGRGTDHVLAFCGTRFEGGEELLNFVPLGSPGPKLWVEANHAFIPITPGTWILKDRIGLYPCHPGIFAETYEVL